MCRFLSVVKTAEVTLFHLIDVDCLPCCSSRNSCRWLFALSLLHLDELPLRIKKTWSLQTSRCLQLSFWSFLWQLLRSSLRAAGEIVGRSTVSTLCQRRNAREACTGTKSVTQANWLVAELVVGPSTKVFGSKHADKFTKQTKTSFRVRNAFKEAGVSPCMSNVLVAQGGDSVCTSLEKSFAWHSAWLTGEVWEHKFILIQR